MATSPEIPSWSALLLHLGATLAPGSKGDRFSYVHGETRCEIGVAQVLAPPGPPWVCLMVWLGRVEGFGLRATLVASGQLPIGSLALLDEQIVLRQTLPLEGLLVTQLGQAIRGLAETASQLQAAVAHDDSPYAYVVR